ncbi:hypothetical protein NDU88_005155 [Pleurodeles waltl]|uniref:Uncharacterized protein n=1 Tax=Pleurodeles waltl TaxID=8319 RepID=A0AAV7WXV2_PLEWA|nr:hypothetical protein NDU88_005155 [Pleurodeles waltl]
MGEAPVNLLSQEYLMGVYACPVRTGAHMVSKFISGRLILRLMEAHAESLEEDTQLKDLQEAVEMASCKSLGPAGLLAEFFRRTLPSSYLAY